MGSRTVVASEDCRLHGAGVAGHQQREKIHCTNANRKQHHDTVRELWLSFFDKVLDCPSQYRISITIAKPTNILEDTLMKSSIVKRSVVIDGHKTSVTLEDPFWRGLKEIAHDQGTTMSKMVAEIDKTRERGNLSSAIRLFVLDRVRTQLLTNPAHWHLRAQDARRLAQKLGDPEARAAKLRMADRYARLAARAIDGVMNSTKDSTVS
jgi:predicted DNA-binding ribbon-helix-helix protein